MRHFAMLLVFATAACQILDGNDASERRAVRPEVSRADCVADGGEVIGDPGDGSTHLAGYRCPGSGAAPLATVVPLDGEPIAIEGEVCCPSR